MYNYIFLIRNLGIKQSVLIAKRDNLINECARVYDFAPSSSEKDYNEAKGLLNNKYSFGEDYTCVDEEINRFLPRELWVNNKIKK